jgi:hypothetical protein
MPFFIWVITLLKGFLPVDGKRIGKIIWVLVLCGVAIGVYHKVFVQKTTKIERIENYYACPEEDKILGIKLNLWKFSIKAGL